ncbi:DUF7504 family protein [Halobaculum litoreum]|uniref:DUF7504 family protein n=1 Tax=Halobaculum litoreum TaxID=3031998 RepID=UPI0024C4078B|nr:hypothetical protein [Halobaculum sp. DT92]
MTGTADATGADDGLPRGRESTLSAALAELEDGCCVLVTGDAPDAAYRVAASRYFGEPDRRRQRLLALTEAGASPTPWLPEGADPSADDETTVVRLDGSVRDPAAVSELSHTNGEAPTATDSPDRLDLDGGSPDASWDAEAVAAAVFEAMDAVAVEDPGRLALRVGLYRADALCATVGTEPARDLLRSIAGETRDRGGMAHLHLPRPASGDPRADPVVDDTADALGDELDVIVELRSRDGSPVPEERWHILEWGATEWNPLR